MFGQNDDSTQSMQGNSMAPSTDMPNADGSLGVPAPMTSDPAMPSMGTMPANDDTATSMASATDGMPPYEPMAGDGGSSSSSSSRDMHAQTPEALISIKQEALQSLKPLVGHLDQKPEERYRTTMMMIQASDDQSLIPDAYEAAKSIEDEKTRAQALLDVVNEINYFTAQHNQ